MELFFCVCVCVCVVKFHASQMSDQFRRKTCLISCQVLSSSFSTIHVEPSKSEEEINTRIEKHAYGKTGLEKRNKEADGLFYLKTVYLPDQLEKNLKQILKSKCTNVYNV